MAYAVPDDVADRLGRDLDETESRIVDVRLGDAERLILSRIPTLVSKVTAGTILVDTVVQVEAEAILRLIRNPEGYSQETDGNYSYMIDQRVASGRLTILDDEWRLLGVRKGIFMIAPRIDLPTGLPAPGTHPPHEAVWGVTS